MVAHAMSCLRVRWVPPYGFPTESRCLLVACSLLVCFNHPFFKSPPPIAPVKRGWGLGALARVGGSCYRQLLPSHFAIGGGTSPPVNMFCGSIFCLLVACFYCLPQFVLSLRPFLLVLGYRSGGAFASFSRVCATAKGGACFRLLNPFVASVSPFRWSGLPVATQGERSAFTSRLFF